MTVVTNTSYRSKIGLIALAYIAFISLGMPDGLFGVAWTCIGMQIAAAGLGGAVVPSLAGVLAQNISLEAIPVYLVGVFAVLTTLYLAPSRAEQVAA